jgi:hypothetical protein
MLGSSAMLEEGHMNGDRAPLTRGDLQGELDALSTTSSLAAPSTSEQNHPRPHRTVELRFFGFGRFRTAVDGAIADLPPTASTILARLILARGGLVDTEDLYRDCWLEPERIVRRDQRVAVQKQIGMLRRMLSGHDIADPNGVGVRPWSEHQEVLLTERSATTGYRLIVDGDHVDLHRFEYLVLRAGAVRDGVAVDLLVQALGLWRERPLQGLPDKEFVRAGIRRLLALRERACRELMTVSRAMGRRREALVALDELQAAQPEDSQLRELIEGLRRQSERTYTPSGIVVSGPVARLAWSGAPLV